MWLGEEVATGGWLGVRREGKGRVAKTYFSAGIHCLRYTFIISWTFARGRYSLIESDLLRRP